MSKLAETDERQAMKDQELMDAITVLLDDGFSVEQVAEKTGVSVEIIKAWLEALDVRCDWDDWSGRQ